VVALRVPEVPDRGERFVVEEATDPTEGTDAKLTLTEDVEFAPEERACLLRELDAAQEEFERGEGMDALDFLDQLRAGN